jgi:hypothetical protein
MQPPCAKTHAPAALSSWFKASTTRNTPTTTPGATRRAVLEKVLELRLRGHRHDLEYRFDCPKSSG